MIFVNCCDKEQQGQVSCCGHLAILGKPAEVEGFVGSFGVDEVSFFFEFLCHGHTMDLADSSYEPAVSSVHYFTLFPSCRINACSFS